MDRESDQVLVAINYMEKIKNRFADDSEKYSEFLSIMGQFKKQELETVEVIARVKVLFKDQPDLLQGFSTFLPPECDITEDNPQIEQTQQPSDPMYSVNINTNVEQQNSSNHEYDVAVRFISMIRERFQSNDNTTYLKFLQVLHCFQSGNYDLREVISEVVQLFEVHPDIVDNFVLFLPTNTQQQARALIRGFYKEHAEEHDLYNEEDAEREEKQLREGSGTRGRRPIRSKAMRNEYLSNGVTHNVHSSMDNIPVAQSSRKRTQKEISQTPLEPDDSDGESVSLLDSDRRFFEHVKQELKHSSAYDQFLRVLQLFYCEIITFPEIFECFDHLFGWNHPLCHEFKHFLGRKGISADMIYNPPIQTLSPSQLQKLPRVTPSYHQLPESMTRKTCSKRNDEEKQVLNDSWMAVSMGSEDCSYTHFRRNKYEEALFRCEDDRYEADVLIENNRSCRAALERILGDIQKKEATQELVKEEENGSRAYTYRLPDNALSATQKLAIRRLYAQSGFDNEMLELLFKCPQVAISVMLRRMDECDKRWTEDKVEKEKEWKEIQELNYPRSLDHRSFYFRQSEKKQIGIKAMVDAIKKLAFDRRSKDASTAPYETEAPHIECSLVPPSIHTHALGMILAVAQKSSPKSEFQRIKDVLEELVVRLFHLSRSTISIAEHTNRCVEFMVNSLVQTHKGEGKVVKFNQESSSYDVEINGHMESIQRDGIFLISKNEEMSSDEDNEVLDEERDMEIENKCDDSGAGNQPLCDESTPHVETPIDPVDSEPKKDVLYGNNCLFTFYRLYSILFDRISSALTLCTKYVPSSNRMTAHAVSRELCEQIESPKLDNDALSPEDRKQAVLRVTVQFLREEIDSVKYEDMCRDLLGNDSYILFTLDRVVKCCMKQLRTILSDAYTHNLYKLRLTQRRKGQEDSVYRSSAISMPHDARNNLFKVAVESMIMDSPAFTSDVLSDVHSPSTEQAEGPKPVCTLRIWYMGTDAELLHSMDNNMSISLDEAAVPANEELSDGNSASVNIEIGGSSSPEADTADQENEGNKEEVATAAVESDGQSTGEGCSEDDSSQNEDDVKTE